MDRAETHVTEVTGCAVDYWKNHDIDTCNGTYDAYTYIDDLKEIFKDHNTSKPFFLYLPLHNVHAPFEALDKWMKIYPKRVGSCFPCRLLLRYHEYGVVPHFVLLQQVHYSASDAVCHTDHSLVDTPLGTGGARAPKERSLKEV